MVSSPVPPLTRFNFLYRFLFSLPLLNHLLIPSHVVLWPDDSFLKEKFTGSFRQSLELCANTLFLDLLRKTPRPGGHIFCLSSPVAALTFMRYSATFFKAFFHAKWFSLLIHFSFVQELTFRNRTVP